MDRQAAGVAPFLPTNYFHKHSNPLDLYFITFESETPNRNFEL